MAIYFAKQRYYHQARVTENLVEFYQARETLKRRVIEAFIAQDEVYQIRLFGWEVEGKHDGYSDIDMVICSNDPAQTQTRYREIFHSISPIRATFPLIGTPKGLSEMILLADYSPYHKIDFSIGDFGKEEWQFLIVYDNPDKPQIACTQLTELNIRKDVVYHLTDVMFSVARFTKCLFRGDADMYRRWQSITNLSLTLLYEKHFGWQPETDKKKLGAYEFKCLSEVLDSDEKKKIADIYPPTAKLNLAVSYQASVDLIIELSIQKAAYLGIALDDKLIAYIKQFMDLEIKRFQD